MKNSVLKNITAQSVGSKKSCRYCLSITPKEGSKVLNSTDVVLRVSDGVGTASQNKYAEFVVPDGAKKQKVKIIVVDDDGEKVVYEGTKREACAYARKLK